jgi:hypothetical protein
MLTFMRNCCGSKESRRALLGFAEGLENAEEDRQHSHKRDRRATQSNNPYVTDMPVESVSPADSPPVNTELMPYAAPIKTGPATNA